MPNIGPMEIAIVLIIALVVFGPSRLPELGKSAGKGMREFKASISGEMSDDDDEKPARVVENSAADAEPAKS
ncbi:twin-arginine translocase TatA/TatE family subunit [soil metagenome]